MILNKNKCDCKSRPDYHRDDCLSFDTYGNKKQNDFIIHNYCNINLEQAKSRIHRKSQVNTCPNLVVLDYFDKCGDFDLDENHLKRLNKLNTELKELIKKFDIKIHL